MGGFQASFPTASLPLARPAPSGMVPFVSRKPDGQEVESTSNKGARMNQMSKFQRSWILFKSSVRIILQNKILLVFPILTLTLSFFILLFFLAPVALQKTGHGYVELDHWTAVGRTLFTSTAPPAPGAAEELQLKPLGIVYAYSLYFVCMFLATFFNVAFYHEILAALKGGSISISRGLGFALSKWKSILLWSLFAGLVGAIIRAIEEKLSFVGRFIVGLLGTAWSVACVFVIPVIIVEETTVNPFIMLKRSALTLKKTWGESLIGYVGLQFGSLLIFFISLFWFGAAIFLSVKLENYWILAVAGASWLVGVTAFAYLTSVAGQVYRCALFLYATEGTIPEPYNLELLQMAWKMKKS